MNAADCIIIRHEAVHACAALALGGALDVVRRDRHRGFTRSLWTEAAADPVKDGIVTMAPFLDNPVGCAEDLAYVRGLVDAGADAAAIWNGASRLLADLEFRRKVQVIENALMQRTVLDGVEVELLLALEEEEKR